MATTVYLGTGPQTAKGNTTSNDTLSGLAPRNGYTPTGGALMLVTAQTDPKENGLYLADSGAWFRVTSVVTGQVVLVQLGNDAGKFFACISNVAPSNFDGNTGVCAVPVTYTAGSASINLAAPGPIGSTTPSTGAFSLLTAPNLTSPAGSFPLVLAAAPTNSAGASAAQLLSQTTLTVAGSAVLELSNNNGIGNVPNAFYGAPSGGQSDALCDGYILNASGAINDGDVVVWASKNTVAKGSATNSLTTLAGVAVGAAAGGKVRVATRGQVYVNAIPGVAGAGAILGTTASAAGSVVGSLSTGAGTLLGRSLEATGATVAGKVLCQLALG